MEEKETDVLDIANKQMGLLYSKQVHCSQCKELANSFINDVPYCPSCYSNYYYPNCDLLENYQDCQISLNSLQNLVITEFKLLSPANQKNIEKALMRLKRINRRLTEEMQKKKLLK